MDSLEPISVEELVRRHTPELIPQAHPGVRVADQGVFFLLTAGITIALLGALGAGATLVLGGASLAGILGAGGMGWVMQRHQRAEMKRFSKQLNESPWMFYEAVAAKFAAEVERQRARTIGPDSEWGRARQRLETAAQEADRSVAYWTQRASSEPEIAKTQLAAATRLRDKFQTALSGLDERARLLVTFFNECEARVAVLQSTKRDFEEIRKLEALADRSDEVVAHAEGTLVSIGAGFVSEALRVGQALGGLERIGLTNLAGEVPVDQLEALADRIVESADRDRTALERLVE
ncbi:MAG: hypothetical protein ACRENU_17250 [Gemmatimonadaceae bacterium]